MATKKSEWINKISTAWRQGLDSIFLTGNLLIKAKADLAHGQYLGMVRKELPFGPRVAQMLVALARWDTQASINAKHAAHLPRSAFTLDVLRRLPAVKRWRAKRLRPSRNRRSPSIRPQNALSTPPSSGQMKLGR